MHATLLPAVVALFVLAGCNQHSASKADDGFLSAEGSRLKARTATNWLVIPEGQNLTIVEDGRNAVVRKDSAVLECTLDVVNDDPEQAATMAMLFYLADSPRHVVSVLHPVNESKQLLSEGRHPTFGEVGTLLVAPKRSVTIHLKSKLLGKRELTQGRLRLAHYDHKPWSWQLVDPVWPQPPAMESRNSALRLDGVYQAEKENRYYPYLRFYADGTVLSVSSDASPTELVRWFNRLHPAVALGTYFVSGDRVDFKTTSKAGTIDYDGTIEGDQIRFRTYFHSNHERRVESYRFMKVTVTQD